MGAAASQWQHPLHGALGKLIASRDWQQSSLGDISQWSEALNGTLRMMLPAPAQIVLFWGPEFIAFYNDAYAPTIGDKHPAALGTPAAVAWSELWSDLGPLLQRVRDTGESIVAKDRPFYIERHGGRGENVNFDISYSPVAAGDGSIAGVLCIVNETTERVRQQERIADERDRLAQMFEQAPGFMALLSGPEHVFELTNVAYQDLIGGRDVVGKPLRLALPEVEAQGFIGILDNVLASGTAFRGQAVKVDLNRNGEASEQRLLDFVYQPVKDKNGRSSGIFVEGTDVTERYRALQALSESEERLRLAAGAGAIGTWDYYPQTGVLSWDAQCKALFGLPPDAEITYEKSFLGGLHPEDRAATAAAVTAALDSASNGGYDAEYRTIGPSDGVERWVAARGRSTFENGQAVRFTGVVIDISRPKRAEARIADLNRTLEEQVGVRTKERDRIWKFSRDLLGVAELDGTWRSVNPAWARVLGWEPDDIVGKTSSWLVHPDDADILNSAPGAQSGKQAAAYECRMRTKQGQYRILSWTAVPTQSEVYCVARDVTDERVAEANLREAEARLRQAQKMEIVGQLSGGIAHDFNNLLQIVTGNLETLGRNLPADNARLRRASDNAMIGAKRAATLTQRLLAFSRRQPLAPKPLDANKLVSGMSELLHRTLGEMISIETVLAPSAWMIEADSNQLEAALLNLAINSRDAMPEGGKLTIETGNSDFDRASSRNSEISPGQYLTISISDTGSGISKEALAHVFEPFYTTKEPGKGTGLGLSMVYGFVKQSGGHVKIYSEVDVGTVVRIHLPRLLSVGGEEVVAIELPAPQGARGETVLVCEDDEQVRTYSVEVLRELGYRVLEAADAPAALSVIDQTDQRIDLLFTDVVLPGGMTGADLAQEAKRRLKRLRVLFTTGYPRNALLHHGRLETGVELLAKPFSYADLATRVRDVLDKSE